MQKVNEGFRLEVVHPQQPGNDQPTTSQRPATTAKSREPTKSADNEHFPWAWPSFTVH